MFPGAGRSPSDFDAVCSRARVPSVQPDSPSSKAVFDLGSKTPDQSDHEETSLSGLETRLDFPVRPLVGDVTKKFLAIDPSTEDELLKAAAKEVAKCFQLPVSGLGSNPSNSGLCFYLFSVFEIAFNAETE